VDQCVKISEAWRFEIVFGLTGLMDTCEIHFRRQSTCKRKLKRAFLTTRKITSTHTQEWCR